MSKLLRLTNPALDIIGFDEFGERPIIPADIDKDLIETQSLFPDKGISGLKIDQLSVNNLIAGTILVGQYIQSSNFIQGISGFRLNGDGTIFAVQGVIGGFTIGASTLTATNLLIDAGNQKIVLGIAPNQIILDALAGTVSNTSGSFSLNGNGTITGISTKLPTVLTQVMITGTVVETDLINITVPANSLGIGNVIKISANVSTQLLATKTSTFRLKYGGTTIGTVTFTNNNAVQTVNGSGSLTAMVYANGTTATQQGALAISLGDGNFYTPAQVTNISNAGTAGALSAIDSTVAQTLQVTGQLNSAGGDDIFLYNALIEII